MLKVYVVLLFISVVCMLWVMETAIVKAGKKFKDLDSTLYLASRIINILLIILFVLVYREVF